MFGYQKFIGEDDFSADYIDEGKVLMRRGVAGRGLLYEGRGLLYDGCVCVWSSLSFVLFQSGG